MVPQSAVRGGRGTTNALARIRRRTSSRPTTRALAGALRIVMPTVFLVGGLSSAARPSVGLSGSATPVNSSNLGGRITAFLPTCGPCFTHCSAVRVVGGGYDFYGCTGRAPTIGAVDPAAGTHSWSAGLTTCSYTDHIVLRLYLPGIRHTRVIFYGFAPGDLGNSAHPKHWNIGPGDVIEFVVNPGRSYPVWTYNTTAR